MVLMLRSMAVKVRTSIWHDIVLCPDLFKSPGF